ncbi:hypothetical protein [Streptomyces sp. Je 1-369]|nr:hypothetical protein [Streptomyces sp. Je 1-369]WAL96246.1 hypothetical protein NOO62_18175 [Streptomyces sp. Je 1-369]
MLLTVSRKTRIHDKDQVDRAVRAREACALDANHEQATFTALPAA